MNNRYLFNINSGPTHLGVVREKLTEVKMYPAIFKGIYKNEYRRSDILFENELEAKAYYMASFVQLDLEHGIVITKVEPYIE